MANSKYQYVKSFERSDHLLPSAYIVIRLDGRGFHRLAKTYGFARPNDRRALDLMNAAAEAVMRDLPDIALAYGVSDEFSFVFERDTALFERRESKLVSTVVSTFTAQYIISWPQFITDKALSAPLPTFDGRVIVYPRIEILKDYLRWRQVDCHINNLYNTTFWALVQKGGMSNPDAEQRLKGTVAADKNEILFSQFGINYNNEEEVFKKGTVIYRKPDEDVFTGEEKRGSQDAPELKDRSRRKNANEQRARCQIVTEYIDIIKETFWEGRPWLLA